MLAIHTPYPLRPLPNSGTVSGDATYNSKAQQFLSRQLHPMATILVIGLTCDSPVQVIRFRFL